jgi:hypothetical protein
MFIKPLGEPTFTYGRYGIRSAGAVDLLAAIRAAEEVVEATPSPLDGMDFHDLTLFPKDATPSDFAVTPAARQ